MSEKTNRVKVDFSARFLQRFQIDEQLGAGAYGAVFRAKDRESARELAIKVLVRRGSDEDDDRFRQEAELASAVKHENLVSVVDYGSDEGIPFIVYEFIAGRTLRECIDAKEIETVEALACGADIARALAALHAVQVIHRDVKPDNVLVDQMGKALLTDLGIAKWVSGEGVRTATGLIFGTPHYMAPELFGGKPITAAIDSYAFGVMLFEALTGRRPFTGDLSELVRHHGATTAPRLPLSVPRSVRQLVARCLSKQPGERPEAAEIARILDRSMAAGSSMVGSPQMVATTDGAGLQTVGAGTDAMRAGATRAGATRVGEIRVGVESTERTGRLRSATSSAKAGKQLASPRRPVAMIISVATMLVVVAGLLLQIAWKTSFFGALAHETADDHGKSSLLTTEPLPSITASERQFSAAFDVLRRKGRGVSPEELVWLANAAAQSFVLEDAVVVDLCHTVSKLGRQHDHVELRRARCWLCLWLPFLASASENRRSLRREQQRLARPLSEKTFSELVHRQDRIAVLIYWWWMEQYRELTRLEGVEMEKGCKAIYQELRPLLKVPADEENLLGQVILCLVQPGWTVDRFQRREDAISMLEAVPRFIDKTMFAPEIKMVFARLTVRTAKKRMVREEALKMIKRHGFSVDPIFPRRTDCLSFIGWFRAALKCYESTAAIGHWERADEMAETIRRELVGQNRPKDHLALDFAEFTHLVECVLGNGPRAARPGDRERCLALAESLIGRGPHDRICSVRIYRGSIRSKSGQSNLALDDYHWVVAHPTEVYTKDELTKATARIIAEKMGGIDATTVESAGRLEDRRRNRQSLRAVAGQR